MSKPSSTGFVCMVLFRLFLTQIPMLCYKCHLHSKLMGRVFVWLWFAGIWHGPHFLVSSSSGDMLTPLQICYPGAWVTIKYPYCNPCLQNCLLIGWQRIGWLRNGQPIRRHVRKYLLTQMDFNIDFSW